MSKENEWKIRVECTKCGNYTWKRFWEGQNAEGVKLKCAECGAEYVIPHGFNDLSWAFELY